MQIGAVFPQTEIGADPAVIREYAQAVEQMGFAHILIYDHVLGANTASRPEWRGPYSSATLFHEPFVLFGYLAALTRHIELVTGVIVLPQRQTALVAKQAAEVDVLSGGRLRLGVGVGWNEVEYEGLREDFTTRGARLNEQIELLRALWSEPALTFRGRFDTITDAGINPLPTQRSIPIWVGGHSEAAIRRAARLGDGWLPQLPPNDQMREQVARLRSLQREAGRPDDAVGIEARLSVSQVTEDEWGAFAAGWRDLGATHLSVNTMGAGFASVDQHLAALQQAKQDIEALVGG
jgi:probable F420-dependent oxidoreductase